MLLFKSCAFFQISNNNDDDDGNGDGDGDVCMMSTTDYGPLLDNDEAMVFMRCALCEQWL